MPAAYRLVDVASGHRKRVRLSPRQASRPERVIVTSSRRGEIEVDRARWEAGEPA